MPRQLPKSMPSASFFVAVKSPTHRNKALRLSDEHDSLARHLPLEYNARMRFSALTLGMAFSVATIAGLGIWLFLIFKPSQTGWSDTDQAIIAFPRGTITAEVASSTLKQYRGLSGHAPLAKDTGMLFVFGNAHKYPFVMRGMTFPLDFIWLVDNRVADIDENIPPPTPGKSAQIVEPREPITMVLEVPAGTINRLAIHVGDSVAITQEKTTK